MYIMSFKLKILKNNATYIQIIMVFKFSNLNELIKTKQNIYLGESKVLHYFGNVTHNPTRLDAFGEVLGLQNAQLAGTLVELVKPKNMRTIISADLKKKALRLL